MDKYAYVRDDGFIEYTLITSGDVAGDRYIKAEEGVGSDTHYYNHSENCFEEKEPLNTVLVVSGLKATISNVPKGVRVACLNTDLPSDGTLLELFFDKPGSYEVLLYDSPRFKEKVLEVDIA